MYKHACASVQNMSWNSTCLEFKRIKKSVKKCVEECVYHLNKFFYSVVRVL